MARYLAVGDTVPPDLSRLAEQVATGESSPYLRALALETFLAEHYRLRGDAPSGHAYPNLRFFLFDDPRAGGQRGTSEQFAAAFAALGRLMGLPTRVVVGFRTPAGGGPVTGADALAWPEVLFDGVGWVAFDPLPGRRHAAAPAGGRVPAQAAAADLAAGHRSSRRRCRPAPAVPASPAAAGPARVVRAWRSWPAVSAAAWPRCSCVSGRGRAAACAAAAPAARRGTPPQRVLGAWEEVLDALALAGAPPPPHLAAERGGRARRRRWPSARRAGTPAAPPAGRAGPGTNSPTKVNAVGFPPGCRVRRRTDELSRRDREGAGGGVRASPARPPAVVAPSAVAGRPPPFGARAAASPSHASQACLRC